MSLNNKSGQKLRSFELDSGGLNPCGQGVFRHVSIKQDEDLECPCEEQGHRGSTGGSGVGSYRASGEITVQMPAASWRLRYAPQATHSVSAAFQRISVVFVASMVIP